MLARVLIVVCGLMFSHPGSAEWRAINTKNFGSVLIQKEISANNGDPVVALMCLPEPTFIVEWFDNMANVAISIDTCLLYTSPSPRDGLLSRMPSSA